MAIDKEPGMIIWPTRPETFQEKELEPGPADDYLDKISDEDIIALETVLDPEVAAAIRFEVEVNGVVEFEKQVDAVIKNSPDRAPTELYRSFGGQADSLKSAGEITDPAYFVGSVTPQKGKTVIGFEIPSGTKALQLDENTYVLGRNLTLKVASDSLKASAEFHVTHDQTTHGHGGAGEGFGKGEKSHSAKRKLLKKIAVGAVAAIAVTALVAFALTKAKGTDSNPGFTHPETKRALQEIQITEDKGKSRAYKIGYLVGKTKRFAKASGAEQQTITKAEERARQVEFVKKHPKKGIRIAIESNLGKPISKEQEKANRKEFIKDHPARAAKHATQQAIRHIQRKPIKK